MNNNELTASNSLEPVLHSNSFRKRTMDSHYEFAFHLCLRLTFFYCAYSLTIAKTREIRIQKANFTILLSQLVSFLYRAPDLRLFILAPTCKNRCLHHRENWNETITWVCPHFSKLDKVGPSNYEQLLNLLYFLNTINQTGSCIHNLRLLTL